LTQTPKLRVTKIKGFTVVLQAFRPREGETEMKQRAAGNSYIGYGTGGKGAVSNSSRSGKTSGTGTALELRTPFFGRPRVHTSVIVY